VESISEIYLDEVTRTVHKSVLQCYEDMFEIKMAKLGDDAGAMGAAIWAKQHLPAPVPVGDA
jgi:glucokinase